MKQSWLNVIGASSSPNSNYFAKKEMIAILALSFLSNNISIFTLCKDYKREHYLAASIL